MTFGKVFWWEGWDRWDKKIEGIGRYIEKKY